jgi:hypothetical protein
LCNEHPIEWIGMPDWEIAAKLTVRRQKRKFDQAVAFNLPDEVFRQLFALREFAETILGCNFHCRHGAHEDFVLPILDSPAGATP